MVRETWEETIMGPPHFFWYIHGKMFSVSANFHHN
jgi:hypothetical protein